MIPLKGRMSSNTTAKPLSVSHEFLIESEILMSDFYPTQARELIP